MSQQGKRKTKSLLGFYKQQQIQSFLAYFMRILISCVLYQLARLDLANVYAPVSPAALFLCSTARIRQDISPASFAVVNFSDALMSVFNSRVLALSLIFLQL